MAKKPLNLHVISHARWDREGRRTLSELRLHAIHLLDGLIEEFERDSASAGAVLDGQAILVEDYLAVRIENLDAVRKSIQSGRLHVGPWYVLPHQQLVSPEALVRNLLIGTQLAAQLGGSFSVGYMPDASAYISQMPQILRGFGIESSVVGLDLAEPSGSYAWQGPDGSSVLAINLPPDMSLGDPRPDTLRDFLARAKHRAASAPTGQDLFSRIGTVDRNDSLSIGEAFDQLDGKLRGVKITIDDLPDLLEGLKASRQKLAPIPGGLPPLKMPGSLSNRILLKLRNHQVETLLEAWVEPFSAWAWLLALDEPPGQSVHRERHVTSQMALDVVKHTWKTLLHNHNQATIGGCTSDGVAQEALLRFDQAEQLGEELASQSLEFIAAHVATDALSPQPDAVPLVVFNASGSRRTDLASASVQLPVPDQQYELVDDAAQPVSCEMIRARAGGPDCTVRFVARDVPERGYRAYVLRPTAQDEPPLAQRDEETTIENEFITVTFDPSTGMFNLFDKRTGRTFTGLNHFVDEGDCGSLQEFQSPPRDTVIDIATNTPIFVERTASAVEQSLTYLQIYRLPRQLTEARDARLPLAAQFVPVSIVTQVRLIAGVPRVDVKASVANDAMDHRLAVYFEPGLDIQGFLVDSHFEVRDYSQALTSALRPGDMNSVTVGQRAFATLWGTDTGLTIANRGLPEVTVKQDQNGVRIALSLVRATGLLTASIGQDGLSADATIDTPRAQCMGEFTFFYSIIPHGQDALSAWHEAWAYQSPLRVVPTQAHPGVLLAQASLVAVDNPQFVISAVKTGEDGRSLIVRGYSISPEVESVTLRPGIGGAVAQRARIDETPTGDPISPDGQGGFTFEVRPAEVVTVQFEPPSP